MLSRSLWIFPQAFYGVAAEMVDSDKCCSPVGLRSMQLPASLVPDQLHPTPPQRILPFCEVPSYLRSLRTSYRSLDPLNLTRMRCLGPSVCSPANLYLFWTCSTAPYPAFWTLLCTMPRMHSIEFQRLHSTLHNGRPIYSSIRSLLEGILVSGKRVGAQAMFGSAGSR